MTRLWELFARLGRAALQVLEAEVQSFSEELRGTGRRLLVLILWLIAAVQLAVVSVALFGIGVARLLEIHVSPWAAALLPGLTLLCVAALMAWRAWRELGSMERPLASLSRRVADHASWWREEIVAGQEPETEAESGDD